MLKNQSIYARQRVTFLTLACLNFTLGVLSFPSVILSHLRNLMCLYYIRSM